MNSENITKAYVNKEDFIKMIQDLPFDCVSTCSLNLITGFIIDKENEDQLKPVGYRFRIGDQYYE